MRVRATAPCRVDLAGGTLDIWPLGLLRSGSRTVNVAIDLQVTVEIATAASGCRVVQGSERATASSWAELLSDPSTALAARVAMLTGLGPAEISIESGSPRGGGLGASSALTICLLAACERFVGSAASAPQALAAKARDLEAGLMRLPTGIQDHVPALVGGALALFHEVGGTRWQPIAVDLAALAEHMLVVYTGQSHFSAGNNWDIIKAALDADPEILGLLAGIAETAEDVERALAAGDFRRLGEAVGQEWRYRQHLAESITTSTIDLMVRTAEGIGAWGVKACGAGGGGCLVVLAAKEHHPALETALTAIGGEVLPVRPTARGLEVAQLA